MSAEVFVPDSEWLELPSVDELSVRVTLRQRYGITDANVIARWPSPDLSRPGTIYLVRDEGKP